MTEALAIGLGTLIFSYCGGIVAWAFRLEGKVNAQEKVQAQKHDDLKGYIKEILDAKFEGLHIRLARIEQNGNGNHQSNV